MNATNTELLALVSEYRRAVRDFRQLALKFEEGAVSLEHVRQQSDVVTALRSQLMADEATFLRACELLDES